MRDVTDLVVWQRGMDLAQEVYPCAGALPQHERFELGRQLRRAAISVPSNIAEGYARRSARDYARFLSISAGSVREIETQLLLACRLGMLRPDAAAPALRRWGEVGRMLTMLVRRLSA